MSDLLRAAREKLRGAMADIDARLAELQAEVTQLREHRAQLVALLGEDAPAPAPAPVVDDRQAAAEILAVAKSYDKSDYASSLGARIVEAVRVFPDARFGQIHRFCKGVNPSTLKRAVLELVADGTLVTRGQRAGMRYALSARAKRTAAARPSTSSPADDDGHGAHEPDTSAGAAGVSAAPLEQNAPTLLDSRPPADVKTSTTALHRRCEECGAPFAPRPRAAQGKKQVCCSEDCQATRNRRLATQSMAERRALDRAAMTSGSAAAIETEKPEVVAMSEDDQIEGEVEPDEDDPVFEVPPYRAAPEPAPYKPGTRVVEAKAARSKEDASWWMRPNANFAQEAERMRKNPRPMRIPGENRIIGMEGVF